MYVEASVVLLTDCRASECVFFFFKQKPAYEMRISDWSSDVCSSDRLRALAGVVPAQGSIRLGDIDLRALRPAQRARRIAYLPQSHELAWDRSEERRVG